MQLLKHITDQFKSNQLLLIKTCNTQQSKATTWGISIVINTDEIRKYCATLSGINVQHRNVQNTASMHKKIPKNKYVAVHDGRGRGQWWLVVVQ